MATLALPSYCLCFGSAGLLKVSGASLGVVGSVGGVHLERERDYVLLLLLLLPCPRGAELRVRGEEKRGYVSALPPCIAQASGCYVEVHDLEVLDLDVFMHRNRYVWTAIDGQPFTLSFR